MQALSTSSTTATGATLVPDAQQYLRLGLGNDLFAVPIDAVREILEVARLTALPQTPAFVRGVMNLRGAVVPVIDLSARFGRAPAQLGRRTCIVVVEVQGEVAGHDGDDDDAAPRLGSHIVGMLVDAVHEVFDAHAAELEPVPVMGTSVAPEYLCAMARVRGQVCAVLHLDRLLAPHVLAELIAGSTPLS